MTTRKVVAPLGESPAGAMDGPGVRRRASPVVAGVLTLLLLAAVVGTWQVARTDAVPGGRAQPGQPGGPDDGVGLLAPAEPVVPARPGLGVGGTGLPEAFTRPFVTDVDEEGRTVTVDMAADPEAVYAWMHGASGDFEGWTVDVIGLEALGGEERAAFDAAAGGEESPRGTAARACPDLPAGTRTDGDSTVPYLGCDPVTGHEPAATPVRGGLRHSLGTAVDVALAELIPGADLAASAVHVAGGDAVVDLPAGFPDAVANAPVPSYEVDRVLIFTAYSNGALDSVRFRVAGDCLAYASAVGGDMCATVPLPVRLGPDEE